MTRMLRSLWLLVVPLAAMLVPRAVGAALPAQDEALKLAFPDATFSRHEHFLTDAQVARVKALAGTEPTSRFVVAYEATVKQALVGIAFFDTHVVRTQPETAMIAVTPDGKVVRVEVVSFHEPQEYKAPDRWTHQLVGKRLDSKLSLRGDIRPLSGASLTAVALTDATRRALALWQVLYTKDTP